MPSRSSIFNSRLLRSSGVWTVLIVIVIEAMAAWTLPHHFWNHVVDERLYTLEHEPLPDRPLLLLGDSVAHQLSPCLERAMTNRLLSLTCNLMVETTGHHYLYERYVERHPPPRTVFLILHNPLEGNLRSQFTENYIQRCFLKWREITELAVDKKSLLFTGTMVLYKFFPTFRYRMHLQQSAEWLMVTDGVLGQLAQETPVPDHPRHSLGYYWQRFTFAPTQAPLLSAIHLERLIQATQRDGAQLIICFRPMRDDRQPLFFGNGFYAQLVVELQAIASRYSHVSVLPDGHFYPEAWFADEVHFHPEYVDRVAADYLPVLEEWQ